MRICVIGSGYVGLVAGACLAELGHDVVLVDNDPEKYAALQRGEVPIHEEYLPQLLGTHRASRLSYSSNTREAAKKAEVIFIAVGTPPTHNGEADLSYVESVARELAGAVTEYKVIVDKSTVPVYTSEWVRKVMLLNGAREDLFDVVSNPEFLREGTAVTDFLFPDRILIGADTKRSEDVLRNVYDPLISGSYYRSSSTIPAPASFEGSVRLICTSPRSAELIKHASNAYLAMKISFVNAVANVCEAVGADVEEVRAGIGTDKRIGPQFLYPGIGYGGSCFPKDVLAFSSVAQECGCDFGLLKEIVKINDAQPARFIRKLRNALWTLRGKRLGVLGLAFKGGTDDVRESPAINIVKSLLAEGCHIKAYDPAAMKNAARLLGNQVKFVADAYEAAEDSDALLILTEWTEFRDLNLSRIRQSLKYPIVVDGRNLYSRSDMEKHGLMYLSMGRPDVELAQPNAVGSTLGDSFGNEPLPATT